MARTRRTTAPKARRRTASAERVSDVGLPPVAPPAVSDRAIEVANDPEGLTAFLAGGAGPVYDRQRSYAETGLDPATVASIFREADKGYWLNRYADLWDGLRQRDHQVHTLDRGRRVAISTKKFLVHPSDARDPIAVGLATAVRAMVDQIDGFDTAIYSMLSANGPGYALMEPIYQFQTLRFPWNNESQAVYGLHPRELRWVHQRHLYFAWDTDEPHLDLGVDGKLPLSAAPHKLFLYQAIGDGIASARGFMRPATWLHLLGQQSMVAGGIYLRRYGLPALAAYLKPEQLKDAAFKAEIIRWLQAYGDGDPSIFPDWMDGKIRADDVPAASGTVNLHMQWRAFIDACLAKCIEGAVLQSEASGGGPGSYALGSLHEARSYDVSVCDAIGSCEKLRQGLFRAWIDLNGDALGRVFGVPPAELLMRVPLCSRRVDRETTPKERAEILCMFADRGMVGSIGQIRNEYAFDEPTDKDDRFTGRVTPGGNAATTETEGT